MNKAIKEGSIDVKLKTVREEKNAWRGSLKLARENSIEERMDLKAERGLKG